MHGIQPKIKRAETNASRTVLPLFCKFRGDCTFIGMTTTRCVWIPIPAPRLACSISVAHRLRMKRPRGKDTRLPCGVETNPGTDVTAKGDLCRIRRADWS